MATEPQQSAWVHIIAGPDEESSSWSPRGIAPALFGRSGCVRDVCKLVVHLIASCITRWPLGHYTLGLATWLATPANLDPLDCNDEDGR